MTQEEKSLLLKVLCAMLPYNIYCYCNAPLAEGKDIILTPVVISNIINSTDDLVVKPYLRPMSSMTEKEKREHFGRTMTIDIVQTSKEVIDWLNAHYFDYRGLIPMDLALEAPEGMYVIK